MKSSGPFVIMSDVVCPLPLPKRDKYLHLATVMRGNKEYVAYVDIRKWKVWIEEIRGLNPVSLHKIEDDNEWHDLKDFLYAAQLLEIGSRKEIAISEEMAQRWGIKNSHTPREI